MNKRWHKLRILVAILILLPAPLLAEPLAVLTADFTGDGVEDRAELIETRDGGMADLRIHVGLENGRTAPSVVAHEVVWVGGAYGQQPGLGVTDAGSLQVYSMNESIGRNRWHQTLTIAWRDGVFKLAGYTYSWYDTLNLDDMGTCDVNLLNGRGTLTKGNGDEPITTHFRTESRGSGIAEWTGEIPAECGLW